MTTSVEQLMREAIEDSRQWKSQGFGGPFGALVVKDTEIIARGFNLVVNNHDPTAHAEIIAIRNACRILGSHSLAGCEIFASCEPCPMCMAAIYWARIDRVWFACTHMDASSAGFDDSLIYREIGLPPKARELPMSQILREEALEVLEAWTGSADKIPY